jgi:hypothetical protein
MHRHPLLRRVILIVPTTLFLVLYLTITYHPVLGFVVLRNNVAAATRGRCCRYFLSSSARYAAVTIRTYQHGDAPAIQRCLFLLETSSPLMFDPEGPITIDCSDDDSIQESYMEDGVFLVAIQDGEGDGNKEIVGTAGVVIGTTVVYQSDGASRSTPATTTGAVRRVCGSSLTVCQQLLRGLEAWIAGQQQQQQEQVQQLIVLAYPSSSSSSSTRMTRPTSELLERLGYERSATQLPRSIVLQYEKRLTEWAAKDK